MSRVLSASKTKHTSVCHVGRMEIKEILAISFTFTETYTSMHKLSTWRLLSKSLNAKEAVLKGKCEENERMARNRKCNICSKKKKCRVVVMSIAWIYYINILCFPRQSMQIAHPTCFHSFSVFVFCMCFQCIYRYNFAVQIDNHQTKWFTLLTTIK